MSQELFGKQVSNGTGLFSGIASSTVGPPVGGGVWQSVQTHSQMCNSTKQNLEMSEVQENSLGMLKSFLKGSDFIRVRRHTQGRDNVTQVEQFSVKELAL